VIKNSDGKRRGGGRGHHDLLVVGYRAREEGRGRFAHLQAGLAPTGIVGDEVLIKSLATSPIINFSRSRDPIADISTSLDAYGSQGVSQSFIGSRIPRIWVPQNQSF